MANKNLTKALLHGFTGAGLFKKLDYPGAPKEFVHMTPEGRELIYSDEDFAPNTGTPAHTKDSDCTVDPTTHLCTVCGVEHGEPCPRCGARGFHKNGCAWLAESTVSKPPKREYIDITPESLKTQEGIKRVSQAQKEWDDATHELANTLKRVIDEVFDRDTDKITRAEHYSELQTLIGIRELKQEAFLRAVAGR